MAMTGGHGVDGVLITASAKHDTIVSQSAQMTRKRGRLVLVGVVNLELNRAEFYEKELTFQVSCSYGPGRYDPRYEQQGIDYPLPFVRWTEQRNIEAVLDLVAQGRLDVQATDLASDRPIPKPNRPTNCSRAARRSWGSFCNIQPHRPRAMRSFPSR